jgi:hypothetical protein
MIFVALCAIAALACYGMGFYIGKLYAEQKIHEQREEMGIDDYKEVDPYDVFYKEK